MSAPEYRIQLKRWFVETGFCDGGGIGHWVETEESVEVAGEVEATTLTENWLASGKLRKMPWGELRPQWSYGLFRVRQAWEDIRADTVAEMIRQAEREACADVVTACADALAQVSEHPGVDAAGIRRSESMLRSIAAAIRARGDA